jgi:glycosyl transferase, family 25
MNAYVINLDRSPDRRAHITAQLRGTGMDYEVVSGVDGRDLDLTDSMLVDPSLTSRCPFPAGAAGCALSHLAVYKRIREDGLHRALVLEDDVTLPTDLGDLVDEVAIRRARFASVWRVRSNCLPLASSHCPLMLVSW